MPRSTSRDIRYLHTAADTPDPISHVYAFHGEKEVGHITLQGLRPGNPERPTPLKEKEGHLFDPEQNTRGMVSRAQIRGAYVHPDYQRQGIGTSMFHIAHQQFGEAPMHDVTVTKEAQAWAGKVGGKLHPKMNEHFEGRDPLSHTPDELRQSFDRNYITTFSERSAHERTQEVQPLGRPSR